MQRTMGLTEIVVLSKGGQTRTQFVQSRQSTMRSLVYISQIHNPHETLAIEEVLLDTVGQQAIVLFLYTHDDSVIVGRNQNVWAECRHDSLISDGGIVARRISGGGAVFHDAGNLNFSFIVPRHAYDFDRQSAVLLNAVRSLGIDAELSGRNDITAGERKFSGNAFCFRSQSALHHGTLLVSTDMDKMQQYLQVSPDKIRAKGIASVRSRVVNLRDLNQQITVSVLLNALVDSFSSLYGAPKALALTEPQIAAASELARRNASWDWIFGRTPPFNTRFSGRFSWGGIEFCLSVTRGQLTDARVYSDALDETYIMRLEQAIASASYRPDVLSNAARAAAVCPRQSEIAEDIANLFAAHV